MSVQVVTPAQVRAAVAERVRTLPGFATVWEYEPEQLGPLPAATMMLSTIQPQELATGPRLDVTWNWQLRIYVNLSDWQAAQEQLEELAYSVLGLWRDDPTLEHLIEWWRIADTGEPPIYSRPDRWLRKSLLVRAQIEDVLA